LLLDYAGFFSSWEGNALGISNFSFCALLVIT